MRTIASFGMGVFDVGSSTPRPRDTRPCRFARPIPRRRESSSRQFRFEPGSDSIEPLATRLRHRDRPWGFPSRGPGSRPGEGPAGSRQHMGSLRIALRMAVSPMAACYWILQRINRAHRPRRCARFGGNAESADFELRQRAAAAQLSHYPCGFAATAGPEFAAGAAVFGGTMPGTRRRGSAPPPPKGRSRRPSAVFGNLARMSLMTVASLSCALLPPFA